MLELRVEDYLRDRVKALGGETRKVRWPGRRGAPDRLVLMLDRPPTFVEVKRPKGGIVAAHQKREHKRLRGYRCRVVILDSIAAVDRWLDYCDAR